MTICSGETFFTSYVMFLSCFPFTLIVFATAATGALLFMFYDLQLSFTISVRHSNAHHVHSDGRSRCRHGFSQSSITLTELRFLWKRRTQCLTVVYHTSLTLQTASTDHIVQWVLCKVHVCEWNECNLQAEPCMDGNVLTALNYVWLMLEVHVVIIFHDVVCFTVSRTDPANAISNNLKKRYCSIIWSLIGWNFQAVSLKHYANGQWKDDVASQPYIHVNGSSCLYLWESLMLRNPETMNTIGGQSAGQVLIWSRISVGLLFRQHSRYPGASQVDNTLLV